jgi:LAGLIDADG endonuclease
MAGSDNVQGAENQQERLTTIGWIVGFVDGEGCFSCSIYRNRKMTLRWQVRPSFDVVQAESSRDALEELVRFFDCGNIYRNRRRDNHREDLLRYNVYRLDDLRMKIVPFFRENPLRTSKRDNFEKFARIIELMEVRRHLSIPGIVEIAEIQQTMNHRKPSEALRILRDHTPALFDREEDEMVRSLRRRKEAGGNDQPSVDRFAEV